MKDVGLVCDVRSYFLAGFNGVRGAMILGLKEGEFVPYALLSTLKGM